jgi:hypothetical protein
VQGGISNGEDIVVRVAFKPTATISQAQQTVTRDGRATTLEAQGRHDPCVLPRAVPMVEAMVCLVLAGPLAAPARGRRVGALIAGDLERDLSGQFCSPARAWSASAGGTSITRSTQCPASSSPNTSGRGHSSDRARCTSPRRAAASRRQLQTSGRYITSRMPGE